jgi:polysaccharide export outer membrane protein
MSDAMELSSLLMRLPIRELVTKVAMLGVLLTVSGCGTFFPVAGPRSQDINSDATKSGPPYALVSLSADVIKVLGEYGPEGIVATFGDRRPPPEIKFGIGDVVSVTIFEAAAGGLFIPGEASVRPGNFVTLPNQPVDTNGNIAVPYAGAIKAAGRTPAEVQKSIVAALANRAIEPQAVVALTTQNTSLISVLGEVNNPNRFPAQPAGEHLLDAITRGGGIKDQGYDSWVVLERRGRRASVPFGSLIYQPENNVWVWPSDTVYVYREPQTFLAFGASGQQGQFNFDAWRITLAEAVAKAGGLLDVQADPASVYLYRREPREIAERIGVDCSKFVGPTVPVIYNVNFRDPGGYFLGSKLQMRNKDIIFAADAPSVELTKFLNLLYIAAATGNNATYIGTNIQLERVYQHTRHF